MTIERLRRHFEGSNTPLTVGNLFPPGEGPIAGVFELPEPVRSISAGFVKLADLLIEQLPPGAERTVALRKLLEARDAAMRAACDPESAA